MKKPVIVALVASLLSLGAVSLEAAPPPAASRAPGATTSAPAKAAHSKKKAHHVKHVKKGKTTTSKPKSA